MWGVAAKVDLQPAADPFRDRLVRRGSLVQPRFELPACLALFAGIGVAMSRPSIGNPFFWDDLEMIRHYPLSQLASTWVGDMDPLGLQAHGFRPLMATSDSLRYALFGESANANRYLSVAAIALAFSLLVVSLNRFGIRRLVLVAGALLALTSKNLTYNYVWVTSGYVALHMAAFGGVVFALERGIRAERRGRAWLGLSVALWIVALFLNDQGLLLGPVLFLIALILGAGGLTELSVRIGELSPRSLIAAARSTVVEAWGRRPARVYLVTVTAIGVADLAARTVLVPAATPAGLSVRGYAVALVEAVSFAGSEEHRTAFVYCGLAFALFVLLIGAAFLGQIRGARLTRTWLTAMLAAVAVAVTSLYGLQEARQDLTYIAVLFYGIYVAAAILLAWQLLERHPRLRAGLVIATTAAAIVSTSASIRGSIGVQHAMSRWSIQTLGYDYPAVYGSYASRIPVPPLRKARIEADLRSVGISRPLKLPAAGHSAADNDDSGFAYLFCRARADRNFRARIPSIFAWDRQALPEVSCDGDRVARITAGGDFVD